MPAMPDDAARRRSAPPESGSRAIYWRPPTWSVVASAVVFVVVTLDVVLDGPLRHLDQGVADFMWRLGVRANPQTNAVGFVLSQAGGRVTNLVWVAALCVGCGIVYRTYAPILRLTVGFLLLTVAIYAGKWIFARTAPAFGADLLHQAGSQSYPSGHQANAVLISGIGAWIATEYVRTRWLRTLVRVYAVVGPCVAAVAVLLLNYHWLTDVLAGFAIGILLLWLVQLIFSGPRSRLGDLPYSRSGLLHS